MNYNESTAALRRIPVYLEDTSGDPVTGATPSGSQIKVSKSGAAFVNGAGTWTEVGSGVYYYEATQAETATDSFLFLRVAAAGALVFPYAVDIGDRIVAEEPVAAARRIPIYLQLSGSGVTGITLSGSEIQVSINGAAFVNGTGTSGETGLGAYYYEAALAEVSDVGYVVLKVIDAAADDYVYTFDIFADSVSTGDSSYFGSYFGSPGSGSSTTTPTPPTPITATPTATAVVAYAHVSRAFERLPEQFKGTT